jgi:hypothetical protein
MTEKLVSDEEVRAAKVLVDKVADFAGHKPIPDFIVRFILEEAAMVRMGMKPMPVKREMVRDTNSASGFRLA